MKPVFLSLFLSLSIGAIACSGIPQSFCWVKTQRPGDYVLSGVVVSTSSLSITMRVLDVLTGVESRSIVTIWNGADFDCNGNVSMKASNMGNLGDTIIAILPLISAQQNPWDVIGDYRRPLSLFQTAWLSVRNDTVRGHIFGAPIPPYMSLSYSTFKNYWLNHAGECVSLGITENSTVGLNISVIAKNINIRSHSPDPVSITLSSIDGRLIKEIQVITQAEINCTNLTQGIYLLVAVKKDKTIVVRKVIL